MREIDSIGTHVPQGLLLELSGPNEAVSGEPPGRLALGTQGRAVSMY